MTARKDALDGPTVSMEALRMRPNPIRALSKLLASPHVISFGGGVPSAATFPKEQLADIAARLIREQGDRVLQYGTTKGVPSLLDQIVERMRMRGVAWTGVEHVLVTSGSQQALDLVARVLVDPGDVVFVELPSYVGGLASLYAAGADLVGVRLTASGPDLERLEASIAGVRSEGRRARAIYTIPTFQNPSGITASKESRVALLEIARRHGIIVIEDDPYGEVYFSEDARPPEPIASLDGASAHVVYLGSFSKVLCPGLRTGWIVAEPSLTQRFELAKEAADLCSSVLDHSIVATALAEGLVDTRLPQIRAFYAERCGAMLRALDENAPSAFSWTQPTGGLFVWLDLPREIDARARLDDAVAAGVAYVPGAPFFVDGTGHNSLRLAFSKEDPARIAEGIATLVRVIGEPGRDEC
jgi:2-aminoadipate transaminase